LKRIVLPLVFISVVVGGIVTTAATLRRAGCNHGTPPGPEPIFKNLRRLWPVDTGHTDSSWRRPRKIQTLRDFALRQKVLLLSATDDPVSEPEVALAIRAFRSFGVPYEHRVLTAGKEPVTGGPLQLEAPDGSGLYSGVVLTTSQLAYQNRAGQWVSALTRTQWTELEGYEEKFDVRRVALYGLPLSETGTDAHSAASGDQVDISFDRIDKALTAGIRTDVIYPIEYSWHYPTRITDPTIATPVLRFELAGSPDKPVAAAEIKRAGRVAELHFFFAQSELSSASLALNNLWVQWLTRGFYVGARRVLFSAEVDDLFMVSDIWDPATESNPENETRTYRISQGDLDDVVGWQTALNAALPATSDFKIDFAFNGSGVDEAGGELRDGLFQSARRNRERFYWINHTFTHADLTLSTAENTRNEVQKNVAFSRRLLGLFGTNFSTRTIVTPQISGLFNRDALTVFGELGISNMVGDTSRAELKPAHDYRGRYTTVAENGVAGLLIIPRNATEIYYDASIPEELTSEYNFRYRSYWRRNLTLSEIMDQEARRVGRQLLSYQPAPHMLHQANLRLVTGLKGNLSGRANVSVAGAWAESVLKEYLKFGTLPVRSLKGDAVADDIRRRMDFEDCGFSGTLVYRAGKATDFTGVSSGSCRVAITGLLASQIDLSNSQGYAGAESYGPDSTLWFTQSADRGVKIKIR
jgi:hypothetical protein